MPRAIEHRAIVSLILLSLGCEGGSGTSDGAPDTLSEFVRGWSERTCVASVRCAPKLSSIESALAGLYCQPDRLLTFAGLDRFDERMTIDPAAAERCLASIEDVDCGGGVRAQPLACAGLITNPRGDGESCWFDGECASNRCEGLDMACEGRCAPALVAGDACGTGDRLPTQCGAGLACSASVCVATTGAADSPCDSVNDCAADLACLGGRCTRLLARGESCTPASLLGPDRCDGDLVCGEGNVCGDGAERGESCVADRCRPGLRCDGASDVCVDSVGPDGACTLDANCPSGFRCEGGQCAPLPLPGEACSASGACADDAICDAATHRCRLAAAGEACESDGECDGFCDDSVTPAVCASPRPAGSSCEDHEECADGSACLAGTCTACARFGG